MNCVKHPMINIPWEITQPLAHSAGLAAGSPWGNKGHWSHFLTTNSNPRAKEYPCTWKSHKFIDQTLGKMQRFLCEQRFLCLQQGWGGGVVFVNRTEFENAAKVVSKCFCIILNTLKLFQPISTPLVILLGFRNGSCSSFSCPPVCGRDTAAFAAGFKCYFLN